MRRRAYDFFVNGVKVWFHPPEPELAPYGFAIAIKKRTVRVLRPTMRTGHWEVIEFTSPAHSVQRAYNETIAARLDPSRIAGVSNIRQGILVSGALGLTNWGELTGAAGLEAQS